jgi:4-alpha-glucanotransferase
MADSSLSPLQRTAESQGIQTSYLNNSGARKLVSDDTLRRVLHVLGAETNQRLTPPVIVRWQNRRSKIPVDPAASEIILQLEDGSEKRLTGAQLQDLPNLPTGYHRLHYRGGDREHTSLLISAPLKLYNEPIRDWGAFLPLYAAHSASSWGAGNFSDWKRLSTWVAAQGGRVVGTLPILAANLDFPRCEPSPYSPASRLFWNEFFIDVTAIPEFHQSTAARRAAARAKGAIDKFRAAEFIDYAAEWSPRRNVLMILAAEFKDSPRQNEFRAYLRERPEAHDYARFRAACEHYQMNWHRWPGRARRNLTSADYAADIKQFHLYIQWTAQQQLDQTLDACREMRVKFYLDLPLGVNPDGFDAWKHRDFFAEGVSAGAPPDSFFTKGQDWGFAPLHPHRARERHYEYVIDYLRFQMRHTGLLRIDHVMGLHRLWWVPHGRPASEGAYVRYPAEELYAILSVESHRHKTMLVGENLGTVPPEVNRAMDRHAVRRMYVLQYEQPPSGPPRAPEAVEVASLNTHDMPGFAAHWNGADLADRDDLGLIKDLLSEKRSRDQLRRNLLRFLREQKLLTSRRPTTGEIVAATLKFLARGRAEIVLVSLEDLWLEERPQNVPGTSTERPNWRRKSALAIEEIEADQSLAEFLQALSRLRATRETP